MYTLTWIRTRIAQALVRVPWVFTPRLRANRPCFGYAETASISGGLRRQVLTQDHPQVAGGPFNDRAVSIFDGERVESIEYM